VGATNGDSTLPPWAQEIKDSFTSGAAGVFLLHGVRDRYPYGGGYLALPAFLHHVFCAGKTTVVYDISQGVTYPTTPDETAFRSFVEVKASRESNPTLSAALQRPETLLPILEEFLFTRDNAAVIIDYVDKIVPEDEPRFMGYDQRRMLTTLRRWADDPRLLRRNSFVFLIAGALSDVASEIYGRSSRVHVVALPMPDGTERATYIDYCLATEGDGLGAKLEMTPQVLAQATNGLTRQQIGNFVRSAAKLQKPVTFAQTATWKRAAIEAEIGDLVEFTEPTVGLEALAGVDQQKSILLNTAKSLREGRTEVIPKGMLLLGPPGCGKTFCMQCFAHDCGIPFLQLKNVFSKYVGATESNLEKLFHYLEALSPAFVFIDEFDQSYGKRVEGGDDGGVSRRVFGMFNNFLSDERHQGRILFGAATNRPDLIDASTLRAGRFDLKLPFLLPDEQARRDILAVSLKTLGVKHSLADTGPYATKAEGYSGADLKELVRIAQRHAVFAGRNLVADEDMQFALGDYIPPGGAIGDEIRIMELLAVLSCASRSLLPEKYAAGVVDGSLRAELHDLQRGL
jgi:SpoVK/Ycf46/Vps4 family AAA+-type ATPase